MKTYRIIKSVAVAAAATLWLLPASEAQAAIPGADGVYAGVYTGCYQKSAQIIRVIDAEGGETCKPNETQITWNQTGPAGPKGDKGDPGDALKADGPCFNDNVNRYQDCGNGTVTDTVTGLIWPKQADCLPVSHWAEANNAAANLQDGQCGLTDNSSPGDWRLPTEAEWRETIARAATYLNCISPSLTNTAGTGCYIGGPQPFTGVQSIFYWSSSVSDIGGGFAFVAVLSNGDVGTVGKEDFDRAVWPVRSSR